MAAEDMGPMTLGHADCSASNNLSFAQNQQPPVKEKLLTNLPCMHHW